MGKRSKNPKKNDRGNPKKIRTRDDSFPPDPDMDDEIDAFHKQRDIIPLDVDGDLGDSSDEDMEQPVFDFEDKDNDDDNKDDDEDDDDTQLRGLAAKIARQQKFLRQKIGGVEDEMHDDVDEEKEEERKAVWGKRKHMYYSAENIDYEIQSSDEDLAAEEEAEVLKLQKERAQRLHMEDFGLEDDQDESDSDGQIETLQDLLAEKKKSHMDKAAEDDTSINYEEVQKDVNALTKEEQMEVVYSAAPELVGLLAELNDAFNELENKVKPLIRMMEERKAIPDGGMHYLEVKKVLLLTYCQAISFYLLLKSEGHPVRDHPVIARLVEIKNLLDKMKQIDDTFVSHIDNILNHEHGTELEAKQPKVNGPLLSEPSPTNNNVSFAKAREVAVDDEIPELVKVALSMDHNSQDMKSKCQDNQVSLQSLKMMKVRESLEEKLKQKGLHGSIVSKINATKKNPLQPMNGRMETKDDFDDEVMDEEVVGQGLINGRASSLHSSKLSQLASKAKKAKLVSGDDDLPVRDDIGERRRKFELQVLGKAGAAAVDDSGDEMRDQENAGADSMDEDEDGGPEESEDEFYKEVKQQRAAKISTKAVLYSRAPTVPSLPETEVDGKRLITYQMEKNRGLTRARKKLTKIPRKKYKLKHQKAVVRRKGQVREIRKPSGPYGGETTGINTGISRSIRFKS
ncbi:hypothetical protein AAC387_Pa03g2327 [Persea americana]